MKLTKKNYLNFFCTMANPEQRAAYYKSEIDTDAINLSTAENILLLAFYQKEAFTNLGPIEAQDIRYPTTVYGSQEYRDSIVEFFASQWNVSTIDSSEVYGVSGVSAALEILAFSLFDNPGVEVLIPAPMWYGFPWSFVQKPKMKFIPFEVSSGFNLTVEDVEKAMAQHPNAKLLVLTNPNNPLGTNYSRELLDEIYELFLEDSTRHIISDEIYGCSQIADPNDFTSALTLDIYKKESLSSLGSPYSDRIHVVWGLSKDFGLSGFRVGFIISKSEKVSLSMNGDSCNKSLAWFSPFGSLNPYMLKQLFLPQPQLANRAMDLYKGLLKSQYEETAQHLNRGNITFSPDNNGAIFFWIDLRDYLDLVPIFTPEDPKLCPSIYKYDDVRERRLTLYIREKANVILIRGQECFCREPGYFRLCYTAENLEMVTYGIDNMVEELEKLR
jgi:aspartate/methionine/tyrosine aminotransferase